MGNDKVEEDTVEVSEAVAELMAMGEEERIEYCRKVIRAIGEGFKECMTGGSKIAQARAIKDYVAELREQADDIRAAMLFTIKKEFREIYIELLEAFTEISL